MKKIKLMSLLTLVLILGAGLATCSRVNNSDLQETASQIIASNKDAGTVQVTVTDNVATLSGVVEDEASKQKIETSVLAVEGIKSVVNNIRVVPPDPVYIEPVVEEKVSDQLIVATRKGKLNVHNKPGVQELVIAVVDHGETLTLLEKTSDAWWLVRTESGLEGYCNAPYLEEQ